MATFSNKRALLGASTLLLSSLIAAPALAQNAEEIIVTATKRASTIQDVPFSINAMTQADIERVAAQNLEDVALNVAGLTIQNLGPGQSQIAIRGVSAGQIVRDQPGVKEQVGVYLDETVISLSLFTPDLDLFDLNRVETLRGPQGTLFGSGSVGGTVRFITNQPNFDEAEGAIELDLNTVTDGEMGGHVKAMYNAPILDGKAAVRGVVYGTQYGGFIDAVMDNPNGGAPITNEDVNSGTRIGGRLAVTFEPTADLSITPRVIYQEIETDGFNRQEVFNLYANPNTTTRTPIQLGEREQFLRLEEGFKDETFIGDITIEKEFGDLDLTSVSSYTSRDILVSRDASALTGSVSVDLGYPDAGVLLPSNLKDTTSVQQFTQEVRLASDYAGPVQWVGGVFYADTDRKYKQRLPTPGYDAVTDATLGAGTSAAVSNGYGVDSPFNSDLPYSLQQTAVFGEINYAATDRLDLTAGGRYYSYDEERSITTGGLFGNGDSGTVDTTSSSGFTPRVMASYEVNDALTLNAQASQGFRLGGVNDPLNATLCQGTDATTFGGFQSYDDETLWNYEAGMKVAKNGLTFNAAAFYTDIEDLQVTLDAGSCSSRISFNVPESHTAGIEFEFGARTDGPLDFTFSGSFINAEFDSTVADANGNVIGGIREGNRLASVPQYQLAASTTYNFDGGTFNSTGGYITGSMQLVGDRITQPSDQEFGAGNFVSGLPFGGASGTDVTALDLKLDSYLIGNVVAGMDFDTWMLQAYVKNIFDENVNQSFDRERGGRARLGFRTNTPRTMGLTARFKY